MCNFAALKCFLEQNDKREKKKSKAFKKKNKIEREKEQKNSTIPLFFRYYKIINDRKRNKKPYYFCFIKNRRIFGSEISTPVLDFREKKKGKKDCSKLLL